ncbi:MAG: DUF1858 domain-containing protein [Oscillospiraceae bacterium]|nr:DUF1858 domain-containing protein [Oscillospiraceae bacterium]
MTTITKDTIIADLLTIVPGAVPILQSLGMHCLGCPSAKSETLGEACASHGADADAVLAQINALV